MRRNTILLASILVLAACGQAEPVATTTPTTVPPPTVSSTSVLTSTTAAPVTTTEFMDPGQLLVIGDWGSGTLPQGAVAGEMARIAEGNLIAAILTAGDNFYSDDAEFLMMPFAWAVDADVPFWITWGNHDVESDSRIEAVENTFDSPPRWTTHAWGQVEILILDSNQIKDQDQLDYLARAMEDIDRPTIVVFHHPALSCSKHGDTEEVLAEWVPLFDEDVVLVVSGHDHNYQRFEDGGIPYLVSGGGGRPLYQLEECPDDHPSMLTGAELHHFLVISQTADALQVEALDVVGEVIDGFVVPIG